MSGANGWLKNSILRPLKKGEKCQGGALQFEPGEAGGAADTREAPQLVLRSAEQTKLKKFSDAGGSQIQWLPDAGRFTLFEREQYKKVRDSKPDSVVRFAAKSHHSSGKFIAKLLMQLARVLREVLKGL